MAAQGHLARVRHDLLLTDHTMPNLSGAALIALVRRQERATRPAPRPLPIIPMGAGGLLAVSAPTVFLAKPFDLDHLLLVVTRLLAR